MSNLGTSLEKYRSEKLAEQFVSFVEAVQRGNLPSQLPEPLPLRLFSIVFEPTAVRVEGCSDEDSPWYVLLPSCDRLDPSSLPECILVSLTNWINAGCPRYSQDIPSPRKKRIGLAGALLLTQIVSLVKSAAPIIYRAATNYVTYSAMPDYLKPRRFERCLMYGWAGTEEAKPVRFAWWRIWFLLLKSLGGRKHAHSWGLVFLRIISKKFKRLPKEA